MYVYLNFKSCIDAYNITVFNIQSKCRWYNYDHRKIHIRILGFKRYLLGERKTID